MKLNEPKSLRSEPGAYFGGNSFLLVCKHVPNPSQGQDHKRDYL